ncbi:hypothetical protein BG003_000169 [Podila horticola]|nr:hypothetical protein BG003_000169 [Podila horticola]
MDPLSLSRLPPECLQRILHCVALQDDYVITLYALLRTSKDISASALPYLFSDFYKIYNGKHGWGASMAPRQRYTRFLLRSALGTLPKVVSFAIGFVNAPGSTADEPKSMIDYMACTRHLNLDMIDVNPNIRFPSEAPVCYPYPHHGQILPTPQFWPPTSQFWPPTQHFSPTQFLPPSLRDEFMPSMPHPPPPVGPFDAYNGIFGFPEVRAQFDDSIVYYELCWAIARPVLEQLESLTIPVIDMRRYLDAVHRLGRLRQVRFNLDKSFSRANEGATYA